MLQVFDNFFDTEDDFLFVVKTCQESNYKYGEKDYEELKFPTGLISNIDRNSKLWKLVENQIQNKIFVVKYKQIHRMYVNCFAPTENPYFHKDGHSGYTLLFYPTIDWNLDEGGETQFIINNEIKGVLPIPNRMIAFNANILHKATSFRSKHRFTLAVKYK